MTVRAIILAGSRKPNRDALERAAGVDQKALLPVLGRPMIAWVVEALRAAPSVADIVVSAKSSSGLTKALGNIPLAPVGRGPSESVRLALERYDTPMLITTADHPLLRAEWIETVVREAEGTCDFAIAVASEEVITRDVASTNRTYIRLADAVFSGCNMFYAATPKAKAVIDLWHQIERNRKKPWRLAFGIGWPVLCDVLRRRLTRARLCEHMARLTGAKIKFIEIDDGRAAVDVDKPADLILVENLLSANQAAVAVASLG